MRNYDANNIFAKILRGELPSHKVYEDDETLAFMDIMPRCEGHTLVVPKTPARNVLDANPAQLAACMKTVQKVSLAIMKACNADGITVQQFNEQAGGQVVFHLHFHVLPRREGVTLGRRIGTAEPWAVLAPALASPWALRAGVASLRKLSPEGLFYAEEHFGRKLRAQHRVMIREMIDLAREKRLPHDAMDDLQARLGLVGSAPHSLRE